MINRPVGGRPTVHNPAMHSRTSRNIREAKEVFFGFLVLVGVVWFFYDLTRLVISSF